MGDPGRKKVDPLECTADADEGFGEAGSDDWLEHRFRGSCGERSGWWAAATAAALEAALEAVCVKKRVGEEGEEPAAAAAATEVAGDTSGDTKADAVDPRW